MRKSLFSQTFTYLFLSILLVVILLSSIFFISIRRSVAVWNVNRGQRLESLILPILTQVYRESGDLQEVTIHNSLSPFLTSNVFAYVFDSEQEPIYIYSNGGRVPSYSRNEIREALERLEERDRPLTPIVGNGNVIGYLAADTLGFSHDVANRRFLSSVFSFMAWGAGIAVIVAAISAFIFSSILSRQARSLVKSLQKLTNGEREIDFPSPQAEELHAIAKTAGHLQFRLQKEEQLRRQWAGDVAHDLRTPISALKVQLEGLTDGLFEPDHERLLSLNKEVERIESLVQDLRELNNMESPEMKLNRETLEVEPLLLQIISGFSHPDGGKKPEITFSSEIETCNADRHYINRALTNVVQNAVQHGDGNGDVHIAVYRRDGLVYFDVSNPGFIDPQKANRFFDRLYRDSSSRTSPGAGLGLPISRAIMRLHGGDAGIRQEGDRTHVYLSLDDRVEEAPRQNGSRTRE